MDVDYIGEAGCLNPELLQLNEVSPLATKSNSYVAVPRSCSSNGFRFLKPLHWDAFVEYWVHGNMMTKDIATQICTILKQPDLRWLLYSDLDPVVVSNGLPKLMLQSVSNPGLFFMGVENV